VKVGVDAAKIGAVREKGPFAVLDHAKAEGFDGVFYRTMLDLSPTLDAGTLQELRARADELCLYIESGIGWVNPYNTSEIPFIRAFGKGDYRRAQELMIQAAHGIGCNELWAVSAHTDHGSPPFLAYDRMRTDVSWDDQMAAMKKYICTLAPLLRDLNCRINLETHGDETSTELLRLIEELGPDIVGVTLDTGNLPLSGDVPMAAIKRLAPYVHMTHCKDGILFITGPCVVQQIRPLGEGVIDWKACVQELSRYSPDLHLSIEYYRHESTIPVFEQAWRSFFPDFGDDDAKEFQRLAAWCAERMTRGEIAGIDEFRKIPNDEATRAQSIRAGVHFLRECIRDVQAASSRSADPHPIEGEVPLVCAD
jgi:sugar phosphate isomerase/epimerase